jgi:uncharacterized membrane protein (DUF106 family)
MVIGGKMKDKIIRSIAIATVSIISAALIAYLKDEENRKVVKKVAKKYQAKFQKSARKAKTAVNKQLKERKLEYRL